MIGHFPSERPERAEANNSRRLETMKDIAVLSVMVAVVWMVLSVFWPKTFGSISSEIELTVLLCLVSTALILACVSGFLQVEPAPQITETPVARETLVSVSLPELSVHRGAAPVPTGHVAAPHTTAPVSEPVLTLPE